MDGWYVATLVGGFLLASMAAGLLMAKLVTRWQGTKVWELADRVGTLEDMTNRHTAALNHITLGQLSDVVKKAYVAGNVDVEERHLNDCPHRNPDSKDPNETSIHFHGPLPPKGAKLILTMEREHEGVEERHVWQKLEITTEGVKDVTPKVGQSYLDPTMN